LRGLLSESPKATGIVFTYNGLPLSWIRKGWLGALKRAGLRHFRFHDLRHSFNTRLMEAGVIQDVRMALMGHSGGSKVHSIYTHVELPVKREAIARLERWVQQQRQGGQHASETADGTGSGQISGSQTLEEENSSGSGS
jgi:integrase